MIPISISLELKDTVSRVGGCVSLGCITTSVVTRISPDELWEEMDQQATYCRDTLKDVQVSSIPAILAVREAYKSLGKDPSRYRGSAEALVKRITTGKSLFRINNVVDVNNLVSLKSMRPVGTYDLANLSPPVVFTRGATGLAYKGIGKDIINVGELPVFMDTLGPYGSPTSDSERAMIRSYTSAILLVIISFTGKQGLQEDIGMATDLLAKYAEATAFETAIIE